MNKKQAEERIKEVIAVILSIRYGMVVVGVVSIWIFGMMVHRYAQKALMVYVFLMDSSTGKGKNNGTQILF